ncbi:MAG: hypothetical protein J6P28_03425 [Treponema sp.]|nr:hypothetical protein [Treponema sp.]
MNIKEIELGFPVFRNYTVDITENQEILDGWTESQMSDKTERNIKLLLSCTAEQKKNIPYQTISAALRKNDAIKSVKVVYDVKDSAHVRAPEIIRAKTQAEKLSEYIKVNKLKVSDTVYSKLKEIEDSLSIKYAAPHHTFTLLEVKLMGSIGIKEGTGRDEFTLDLRNFVPGVVALAGQCGRGKSTLIENCQPYLRMLTRTGKLQDHFFLRDSYRELLYVDEGGIYYRIRIDIDGKNKSGKVKAFAFTGSNPDNLNPVDGLDGNVDQYNEWVVNTFGSIELFLRTVFYTKGNTGSVTDIASATKGEKKSFFNSLLGTESASEISAASREKSKELKAKITEKETLIDDSDYDAMIKEVLAHGKEVDKRIKTLRDEIKKLNAELDGLKKTDSGTDIDGKIREKESQLLETKGLLATYTTKKENFGKYEKIKPLLEKADSIRNRISERQPLLDANREEVRSLEAKEKEAYTNLADAKADVTAKRNLVTDIADTCPTCGQKLPAEKVAELEKQAVKNRKALEKAESKLLAAQEAHDLIAKELADTNRGVKWLERENEKDEKEISELGIPDEASLLKMEAESTDINALNEYLSVYTKKTSTLEKELSQLKKQKEGLGPDVAEKMKAVENSLSSAEGELQELLVESGKITQEAAQLKEAKETNEQLKEERETLVHEQTEWEFLERAFGANGIQALELEAAAPDVADITNRILESAYGDKFKISFQTLRKGSTGAYIEVFDILVENTETSVTRPLEWVSGGEGTWIKEALYHAFSIIRSRSQSAGFRTRFLDETDGALDHDSKLKYLKMIETVHEEGGADKTVLITHSQELKDIITQRIEL